MNLSLMDLVWMAVFAGAIAYWLNAMRAKEIARAAGKRLCQQAEVMILDDTVSLKRVRLKRNGNGQLDFQRDYEFEFTSDGEYRYKGELHFLGRQLLKADLGVYRVP